METKQKEIAKALNISTSYMSLIFKGEKPISFPLAVRLSKIFPKKDIEQWKNAKPEELKKVFRERKTA